MTDTEFTGSGTDDRLRVALEDMANELAAKTTMPFAVPVKQILTVIYEFFADVPRVPNYDADLPWHEQPTWSNTVTFSLTELPDAPRHARAYYRAETGMICLQIEGGETCDDIELEPSVAQGLFLAGLAAVAHAQRQ